MPKLQLSDRARRELRAILARARVADSQGAALRLEQQCGSLLDRLRSRASEISSPSELRQQLPAELRSITSITERRPPADRHLTHLARWARYWLHREGVRVAVGPKSHMAQALQILLDHATDEPRDASELLRTIKHEELLPRPGVVRGAGIRLKASN